MRTEDKSSSSTPRTDRMTNGDKAFEKWWQTWRNANGWADTLRMRTAARSLWDGIAFSSIETAFEKLRAQGHIQTEETAVPSVAQPLGAETLSRAEDTLRAREQELSVMPIKFLTIDFWRARAIYLAEQIIRSAPSHARQNGEERVDTAELVMRLQSYATTFSANDEGLHLAPENWNNLRDDIMEAAKVLAVPVAVSSTEQPVAYIEHHKGGDNLVWDKSNLSCTPLYKAVPSATVPHLIGIDKARSGGDFTGYACSCGQIRVSPDGPCERQECPIRSVDGGKDT